MKNVFISNFSPLMEDKTAQESTQETKIRSTKEKIIVALTEDGSTKYRHWNVNDK